MTVTLYSVGTALDQGTRGPGEVKQCDSDSDSDSVFRWYGTGPGDQGR